MNLATGSISLLLGSTVAWYELNPIFKIILTASLCLPAKDWNYKACYMAPDHTKLHNNLCFRSFRIQLLFHLQSLLFPLQSCFYVNKKEPSSTQEKRCKGDINALKQPAVPFMPAASPSLPRVLTHSTLLAKLIQGSASGSFCALELYSSLVLGILLQMSRLGEEMDDQKFPCSECGEKKQGAWK